MEEDVFEMVKVVGILGDIGSGKSFVAKQFRCPVFNADDEVNKIYESYFEPDKLPARTCIGVTGLAVGASIEIDLIAKV